MNTYQLSIQTNTDGMHMNTFHNKAKALKAAAELRRGGSWRHELTERENPHVDLYDEKKQESIYCKPLFKEALKK